MYYENTSFFCIEYLLTAVFGNLKPISNTPELDMALVHWDKLKFGVHDLNCRHSWILVMWGWIQNCFSVIEMQCLSLSSSSSQQAVFVQLHDKLPQGTKLIEN